MEHLSLDQFGVLTYGKCEMVVHDIRAMLNLHPDWVGLRVDIHNAFNSVSWSTIFQELWFSPDSLDQLFPCVQ